MEPIGSAVWLEHKERGVAEVMLEMEMGTRRGMWLQAVGKEVTEKASLGIKKREGTIAIRISWRNPKKMQL